MKILDKIKNVWIDLTRVRCPYCKGEDYTHIKSGHESQDGGWNHYFWCNKCKDQFEWH